MALKNVAVDENKVEVGTENVPVVVVENKNVPAEEVKVEEKKEPVVTETKTEVVVDKKPDFDQNAFVKENFGYDSVEVAKQELEKLKKPKEAAPLKFENEISERIFNSLKEGKDSDIFTYLKTKNDLSKLDKLSPTDIVKLDLQYKNSDLSADEVDFLLNEKYSIPEKPVQEADELDEDYNKKLTAWEKAAKKAETKISIDSKIAKKDLQKLNTELVLPDIKNSNAEDAKQKELQAQIRKDYEQALESDFTKFNGFSVTYKDKDVEIPISYTKSEEEKVATKNYLKAMDVDDFLGSRWFDKDGKPNIQQQMSDIDLLQNRDKVFQKFVQETWAQAEKHFVGSQKNITIGEPTHAITGSVDNRTDLQKVQDARWKKTG